MISVQVKYKDIKLKGKLHYLRNTLRNPLTSEDLVHIKTNILQPEIEGKAADSLPRALPFHTYPNVYGDILNPYVKRISGGLELGSKSKHASILEAGRPKMARVHAFRFKGFYPNRFIVTAIVRANFKKNPRALQSSLSSIANSAGMSFKTRGGFAEEYTMASHDKSESGKKRMYRLNSHLIGTILQDSIRRTRHGRNFEGDTEYGKHIAALYGVPTDYAGRMAHPIAKQHRYGIYTVYARRLRGIPEYHVFSKAAEGATKYWAAKVKARILKTT